MIAAKRFYRSRHSRVIAGVAGGIGQYFDVDPVLVRVGFVLLAVTPAAAISIVGYILLAAVLPLRPDGEPEPVVASSVSIGHGREVAGIALVGFGLLLLAANAGLFNLVRWDIFWPLALVAAGLAILMNRIRL